MYIKFEDNKCYIKASPTIVNDILDWCVDNLKFWSTYNVGIVLHGDVGISANTYDYWRNNRLNIRNSMAINEIWIGFIFYNKEEMMRFKLVWS